MDDWDGSVVVGVLVFIFLLGCMLGYVLTSAKYEQAAIENNCAEYGIKTGEWDWKK